MRSVDFQSLGSSTYEQKYGTLNAEMENLIHSIVEYSRPDVFDMMILASADFNWSNYYFDNRRHFIGSYGILLGKFLLVP